MLLRFFTVIELEFWWYHQGGEELEFCMHEESGHVSKSIRTPALVALTANEFK